MEAYDLKELGKRLKEKGLIEAEDAAEMVVKEMFKWLNESAVASENVYDNMAMVIYPSIEEMILKKVDAIDGEIKE